METHWEMALADQVGLLEARIDRIQLEIQDGLVAVRSKFKRDLSISMKKLELMMKKLDGHEREGKRKGWKKLQPKSPSPLKLYLNLRKSKLTGITVVIGGC